jgi:hypothetical protein
LMLDGSRSLVTMLCSLMLRWQLVAGGDIMKLGVEMAFNRWS